MKDNLNIQKTRWQLEKTDQHLQLVPPADLNWQPIVVDFVNGAVAHRLQFGGGKRQTLSRAVGLHKTPHLKILDATAGLGGDACVLAHLGAKVTLLERSPTIHALLEDGIARAKIAGLQAATRLHLQPCTDGIYFLTRNLSDPFDVIYLDPMFSDKNDSALSKKEMRALREIVGEDLDAEALLNQALETGVRRVVVKRPRLAKPIGNRKPDEQIIGKSGRFDLYFNH